MQDSYGCVEEAAGQEMFTKVQAAFDPANCHYLSLLKLLAAR